MTHYIAFIRRAYDTWRMRSTLTLLTLTALALVPGQASALSHAEAGSQPPVGQVGQHESVRPELRIAQSGGMSLSQAIESVRRRTDGKVVGAETRVEGGREVHYIRVLTKDGKVKTHKVNGSRR